MKTRGREATRTASLLEALRNLKAGTHSGVTDGRVTITNVAIEAGVSRATAYRNQVLLTAFQKSIGAVSGSEGENDREEPSSFKGTPSRSTEYQLRDVVKRLLNRIIALEARETYLVNYIRRLEGQRISEQRVVLLRRDHD